MGYNRPGNARRQRLKRAKRYNERLRKKAEAGANKAPMTKAKGAVADTASGKKK